MAPEVGLELATRGKAQRDSGQQLDTYNAQQQEAERQMEAQESVLEIASQNQERWFELIDKWDGLAQRVDVFLAKWERRPYHRSSV